MAERTTVLQTCQFGAETTPGTAVAANRRLPSISVTTSIEGETTKIPASGLKFPVGYVPGKEWASSKLSGQPTYDELLYPLTSLMSYAAGVQQAATTAYKWTTDLSSSVEDTIKTWTVESGSAVRAHKFAYGLVTDLTIKGDRSKIDLSGTMLGQRITDGITLTSTPTVIDQIPIMPGEVSIYADDTSAGLGGTKLARVLSWELKIAGRYGPLWVVDAAQTSWATHVELPVDVSLKLLVEADATGMGFLSTLRTGAKKFLRVGATSPTLAGTAIPYAWQFDLCGEVQAGSKEFKDSDGVYAAEWTFGAVHDATWGKALTTFLMNKRATL